MTADLILHHPTIEKPRNWFTKTSRRNKIIAIVVLLILLFILYKIFFPSLKTPQYQTAQVTRGDVISTLSESGNVSAGSETSITSPTTGVITNIYVKNGDQVTAGENLFEVKATATPQDQAAAYATYENAVNSLTTAKDNEQSLDASMWTAQQQYLDAQNTQNYKNNNTTNPSTKAAYTDLEKQSIDSAVTQAQKNFSAAEQKYKDAGTAVAAAQAQLTSASLAYQATQDSIVTAPIDGTVANLSAALGSDVTGGSSQGGNAASGSNSSGTGTSGTSTNSSGTSTSASSPILIIGNFSNLSLKAQVSEVDVPQIKVGQKATITLDAFSSQTFVGNVYSIDTVGTASSGVVTYNVYISFISPPATIQPGMSATATIQLDRHDNVLEVPTSAVQTSNGQSYVRVLQNGKVTQVPVETGLVDDTYTEITSGLSEGQTVVTSLVSTQTTGTSGTSSPFSGLGGGRGGFGGGFGGGGGARAGTGGARGQ